MDFIEKSQYLAKKIKDSKQFQSLDKTDFLPYFFFTEQKTTFFLLSLLVAKDVVSKGPSLK